MIDREELIDFIKVFKNARSHNIYMSGETKYDDSWNLSTLYRLHKTALKIIEEESQTNSLTNKQT